MAPVRSYGNWNVRASDKNESIEPYCKYFFIAEGANTEKFYFEKLIDERKRLGFLDTIAIHFLEKIEKDRDISYPAHLISFAEKLKKGSEISFDSRRDKMVVVFDSDIFEHKVDNLKELLQQKSGSSIYAITNPSFELFLMLHIADSVEKIIRPNENRIISNEKESGKAPIYLLLLEETQMNSKRNPGIGKLALDCNLSYNLRINVN